MIRTLTKVDKQAMQEIAEEKAIRRTSEVFLLFSLGSQFDHLIKQALEKLGVFCLVADPIKIRAADVKKVEPAGIILSGGPSSVLGKSFLFDVEIFDLGIPVLGICLGFQLWANYIGHTVIASDKREFGTHILSTYGSSLLFRGCKRNMPVLESHGDKIEDDGKMTVLAATGNSPVAAGRFKHLWGVQFHPEVTETIFGPKIFDNFCFKICDAKDRFPAEEAAKNKIGLLKKMIGEEKVLLALSGGSDSSTVAYLLKAALAGKKDKLRGVYIKGIDRPDDEDHVLKFFGDQDWINLKIVDATEEFLKVLKGKRKMHKKRVAMRSVYKNVLEREAKRFGAKFIVQGTLYTDVSESGKGYDTGSKKAQIKLHHNVGLGFSLEELNPLNNCVKDTGRNIGRIIGVPEALLTRHPFPGPGLTIRIDGAVTAEKLKIARQIDQIYIEELRKEHLYHTVWQAGAHVTSSVTTCTKGDDATTGVVITLWAYWSVNGFTARWARLPWDFIGHVSQRITNEVREVGAVVYKTTDKPPATIEWG